MPTGERFPGVWIVCDPKKRKWSPANLSSNGTRFTSFSELIEYLWYHVIDPPHKWSTGGREVYFFPFPRRSAESTDDWISEFGEWVDEFDEWARIGFVPLSWEIDTEKHLTEALEFCANNTCEVRYGDDRLSSVDMVARLWADRPATGVVIDNTHPRRPRRRKRRMALQKIG
jgi:hypothetical protein